MANTSDPLSISWHDSAWITILSPTNVMDYFAERSNPFYDRTCNNEIVKMQRLNPEQLNNMTGVEYVLLHVQEPILYVIRKQERHNQSHVVPLADYYIIAGVVYQAPDLCSVINSRMLNCMHSIQSAFVEAQGFHQYHPSKGYWWQFKEKQEKAASKEKKKQKEEPSSLFQRQRVDELLIDLAKRFPLKMTAPPSVQPATGAATTAAAQEPAKPGDVVIKQEKIDIKVEKVDEGKSQANSSSMKPPPDKKAKLLR